MLPLGISSSDCLGHGFEPILTLQAMLFPGLSPKPAGAVTVALKVGTCVSVCVCSLLGPCKSLVGLGGLQWRSCDLQ